jgi:effector-binding domain-containing protein
MLEVEERELREQPTLVMRAKLSTEEIRTWLGQAYHDVELAAAERGATVAGPPFARYRALDDDFRSFDVEAGFPVSVALTPSGDVQSSTLPGGTVAMVTHIGPYEAMKTSYDALMAWVDRHDYVPEGPPWEVYLSDLNEESDPALWRTEIIQPCRKV